MSDESVRLIKKLEREIEKLKTFDVPKRCGGWVYYDSPLTAAAWTAQTFSTTAKTLIDLSAVFGAPAGITAVIMRITLKDSGSAANDCYILWGPTNATGVGMVTRCTGLANSSNTNDCVVVPCDANGDIYYQVLASGANTATISAQIWGYQYGTSPTPAGTGALGPYRITNVTGTYTVLTSDQVVRANGTFTVNLPAATGSGAVYIVKNSGAGTITVDAAGAETIEGAATDTLAAGEADTLLDAAAGVWELI